jgi:hypothetical protein
MQAMSPDRSEWSDAQQHLWELQDRICRKLEIMDEKQTTALDKLDTRLTATLTRQDERILSLKEDVAAVKVKAGLLGVASGMVTAFLAAGVDYLRKHS